MFIRFIGYFAHPNEDWPHAVFEVKDHNFLPDGRYDIDALDRFKVKVERPFLNYFEWGRERYKRRVANSQILKELWKP